MLLGERPVVRPVERLHIDRAGIPVILHHISRRHLHGLHLAPDIYIEADRAFQKQDLDTRHVSALNAEIGAREVSINPLSSHWEEEMTRIADALDPQTTPRQ